MDKKIINILLLLLITLCFPVTASESTHIKVGFYENSPKISQDEQGNVEGFWADITEYIAAEENLEIEWVFGTWEQCLQRLEDNTIDMMVDVAQSPEREERFSFNKKTVLLSWSRIYTNTDHTIETILDLEGKTIGGLKGSINLDGPEGLKDIIAQFDIHCRVVEFESYGEEFDALHDYQVFAAVTNKDYGTLIESNDSFARSPIIFQPINLNYAFTKDSALTMSLIDLIDEQLIRLKADKGSIYYTSMKTYLSGEEPIILIPHWLKKVFVTSAVLFILLILFLFLLRTKLREESIQLQKSIAKEEHTEREFFNIFNSIGDAVIASDCNSVIVRINPVAERLTGWMQKEAVGKPLSEVFTIHTAEFDGIDEKLLTEVLQHGKQIRFPEGVTLISKQGTVYQTDNSIAPIADKNGNISGLVIIFRDITEYKKVSNALYYSKTLLQAINTVFRDVFSSRSTGDVAKICLDVAQKLTHSPLGFIGKINKDNKFETYAVSDRHQVRRKSSREKTERSIRDMQVQDIWETVRRTGQSTIINNSTSPAEYTKRTQKEHSEIFRLLAVPLRYGEELYGMISLANKQACYTEQDRKNIETISATFVEVLEYIKTEEQMRDSEEKFASFMKLFPGSAYIKHSNHKFLYTNAYMKEYMESESWIGRSPEEIYPSNPDYVKQMIESDNKALSEGINISEEVFPDKTNTLRTYITYKFPIVLSSKTEPLLGGFSLDITNKKQIQKELAQMQKIQDLGVFAGGLAHDFNNILTGVYGNISLSMEQLSDGSEALHFLKNAELSLNRAKKLTNQLLIFTKKGLPTQEEHINIAVLIEEILRFDLSGSNVQLEITKAEQLWPADVDKGQIQQVISNLTINAIQAMPDGGTLFVSLDNTSIAENPQTRMIPGKYIQIIFRDTGIGIDRKNLEQIYHPYFTTKPTGNGLGLSIVLRIIENHKGYITVSSELGRGTTFTIYLPASKKRRTHKTAAITKTPLPIKEHTKVLLMDDDRIIRTLAETMLQKMGLSVVTTINGDETVTRYTQASAQHEPFDVVILDLTIPGGKGGEATIKELLALDPTVKAIVSSGYSNDVVTANYKKYGFKGVITKPYTMKDVQRVLSKVLNIS